MQNEKVKHLWNITRFLADINGPEANGLRTHYVRSCKAVGKEVELPKNCFGPSKICYYCDSLWTNVDHRIRILPGKKPSQSIRKLLRKAENRVGRLPKVRATLLKKCSRKAENKMIIQCSVCLMKTKIPFNKPERTKPPAPEIVEPKVSKGKKRKRPKDKTAGLKIPQKIRTPFNIESDETEDASASVSTATESKRVSNKTTSTHRKILKISSKPLASVPKLNKSNIKKLKNALTKSTVTSKKSSLHSFLKELR